MTLREIDDALGAWNNRLGAAAQNLMDLQAEPTYQQLTGTGGVPKTQIAGVTAARVEPSLGAMVAVFQHFGLLNDTIVRAGALRRNLPTLFGSDQKLREIEELICGQSIHLPPVDVPLEQRTLLSGVQNVECISPDALLDTMVKAFQSAKDAVVAVDAAWNNLGLTLDRIGARIVSLRARAAALGSGTPAELDAVERALQAMRAKVQADPLGASDDLEAQIQPVLARVEAAVTARERLRQQIVDGLAAAHNQLDALAKLHGDTVAICAEARSKIADCASLPAPQADGEVAGLCEWLGRLDKKFAEGMQDPVAVGLRNWNLAAEDCVSKEKAACAANRARLDARNELRGRLNALKAKARVYGLAEDDARVELARQAELLLYTQPIPLDRAAAAIAAYEKTLNGAKEAPRNLGGTHRQ
jgi:hypothetical protein